MAIRNSLVAFGISAAVTAGGVAAGQEALHQAENLGLQRACAGKEAGEQACREVMVTDESIQATEVAEGAYASLAVLGLMAGAFGIAGAYAESLDRLPRRRS